MKRFKCLLPGAPFSSAQQSASVLGSTLAVLMWYRLPKLAWVCYRSYSFLPYSQIVHVRLMVFKLSIGETWAGMLACLYDNWVLKCRMKSLIKCYTLYVVMIKHVQQVQTILQIIGIKITTEYTTGFTIYSTSPVFLCCIKSKWRLCLNTSLVL